MKLNHSRRIRKCCCNNALIEEEVKFKLIFWKEIQEKERLEEVAFYCRPIFNVG